MVDSLGYRMKFGVIAPSTNTSVEPEYALMQPKGITNHFCRIEIPDDPVRSDEEFVQLLVNIRGATDVAMDRVMTCAPGFVIMGMSAETFWDGKGGSEILKKRLSERAGGLPVALGSEACQTAVDAFKAKRVAVLTPYWPVGDEMVRRYFTEIGLEVVALKGLKARSPIHIACQKEEDLVNSLKELNASEPDLIIQVGTNLCLGAIAAEAERWLEKPVVAINTAIYHFALRQSGIDDKIFGYGRLLSEH